VTQADADATAPPAPAAAIHRHHQHHHRHSTISLLAASVPARLAIVAGVSVVLWIAILWALA
jgi:hypothetical protein